MQTQTTDNARFPLAAVFTAEVVDFPTWKKSFEAGADFRRSAGIEFSHINHDAENPNLLTIYLGGRDGARVRAFVTNPELLARIQASGVKGTATSELFTPVENRTRGEALAAAMVRQKVTDFDAWKAAFDKHAAYRQAAGVLGYGISRKADDPSIVVVYLQGESVEALRTFLSSPELADKMRAGGVVEKPEITLVHGEQPQH